LEKADKGRREAERVAWELGERETEAQQARLEAEA